MVASPALPSLSLIVSRLVELRRNLEGYSYIGFVGIFLGFEPLGRHQTKRRRNGGNKENNGNLRSEENLP